MYFFKFLVLVTYWLFWKQNWDMCISFVFAYCIPSEVCFVESRQNDHTLSLPRWWLFCPSSLAHRPSASASPGRLGIYPDEEGKLIGERRRRRRMSGWHGDPILFLPMSHLATLFRSPKKDILAGKKNTFYLIWFPSYYFVLQGIYPWSSTCSWISPSEP